MLAITSRKLRASTSARQPLPDTAHHGRTGRAYIQAAPIAVVAKKSAIVNGGNIMFEEGWNTKSESTYSVDYSWL